MFDPGPYPIVCVVCWEKVPHGISKPCLNAKCNKIIIGRRPLQPAKEIIMKKLAKTPLKRVGELKDVNFLDEVIRFSKVIRLSMTDEKFNPPHILSIPHCHTNVSFAFAQAQKRLFRRALRAIIPLFELLQLEEKEKRSLTPINEFLHKPIKFITIPKYANLLAKAGITQIKDLIFRTEEEVRAIKGMCNQGFESVEYGLGVYGFLMGGIRRGNKRVNYIDGMEHWRGGLITPTTEKNSKIILPHLIRNRQG